MGAVLSREEFATRSLTGLAMFESWINRDADAMEALRNAGDPDETFASVMSAMELLALGLAAPREQSIPEFIAALRAGLVAEGR